MAFGIRRLGMHLGSSVIALAIAIPAVPATVTAAGAQNLLDGLFRAKPTRRQLRDQRLRQRRAAPRTRRARRAARRAAPAARAPKRAAAAAPRKPKRSAARAAPAAVIKAPTFKDYKAEAFGPVDIKASATVVAAAIATERMLLEAGVKVRQVPVEPKPATGSGRTTAKLGSPLGDAMNAKALFAPTSPLPARNSRSAGDDSIVQTINAEIAAGDDLSIPPSLDQMGVKLSADAVRFERQRQVAEINDAAGLGSTLGNGMDEPPRFEVVRDPRVDQLVAAEMAWLAMARQVRNATGPVAAAVAGHYEAERRLMWTNGERVRPTAARVISAMSEAHLYGLDPQDYRVPPIPGPNATLDEHMAFELALSVAATEYIRDASIGRIAADGLSGYHDLPRRDAKLRERLLDLAEAADPSSVIMAAHPANPQYKRLQAELASLLTADASPLPTLPKGVLIRAGQPNPSAPALMELLRRRASDGVLETHAEALALYDGGDLIPAELDRFIRDMQEANGLRGDGIIGPRSIARLNGESNATKIERLTLSLERMRWIPDQLGSEYVWINQPGYRVQHWVDDSVNLSMRVVVGKAANQTNFFYDEISHIEFNPDWGVPRSIIVNEMLPRLRRDPSYLDRIGYEVRDSRGRRVSSSRVNWNKYGKNVPFSVIQPSGPRNALGELKIEFPNRHAIYMHDTQAKNLFGRSERAYSHGCVRLHKPREMAAAVLGTDLADVKRRLRKGHHNAKIDRKIPVYISYFTAWVKDDGEIGYYGDIYQRDKYLKRALEKTRKARSA